jgi:tetratricopeptide (TPR) repeat protein
MAIHYNLHRFGVDEFAVGRLINGDLPDDEDERWNVIDAPRYRIEKLLAEHVLARNALRQCRDERRPFVLFLRSFSAENKAVREGRAIAGMMTTHSKELQDSLAFCLMERSVPIIKLFGGSDVLISVSSLPGLPDTGVLSAHADNWLEIVAELVSEASAIVFLISHLTEGVILELGQIRSIHCEDRCLIVLLDPQKTFSRDVGDDIETLQGEFRDFPHVFELEPPRESPRPSATSAAFKSCLEERLLHAITPAGLNQSVDAEFSYLEPDYFVSDDYADTERFLWKELRRFRAEFHDTYWAALKARDISYRELRFETEWLPAHRAYGLAVATADFAAIQAALFPLELLYTVRGSLYLFNIRALRHQYQELAGKCNPSGVRDTESKYTDHKDPLTLSPSQGAALELFRYAETAVENKNLDVANYLYQVSVNLALACDDRDETDSKWMLSRMTHDWAKFQAGTNLAKWAVVNYEFSLSLSRELAATEPDRFLPDVALCLNNLGTLHFRLRDLDACEAAFQEAVEIRRRRLVDSEKYHENLGHSLMNLGMVAALRGVPETARQCYEESIRVTAERVPKEPSAIVDLAYREILLAHCLATMPGAEQDTQDAFAAAEETLPRVAAINPEAARQLEAALRQRPSSA